MPPHSQPDSGRPEPFKRRRSLLFRIVIVLVAISVIRASIKAIDRYNTADSSESRQAEFDARGIKLRKAPLIEGVWAVKRVVDGDTLLLANDVRVRLLGVDTPETVKPDHPVEPFGKEASAFTRDFVAGGQVRLRFDREREDKYGRTLAYVYVDDAMLNEELIRAGFSAAKTYFNYSPAMKKRFVAAEKEARRARRGIWSAEAVTSPASKNPATTSTSPASGSNSRGRD